MTTPTPKGAYERWIVEEYGHSEFSDYPTWAPVKGTPYYSTEQEASAARDALIEQECQSYKAAREKDARECAERAAVYEKATSAVQGMPQAHILGRGYRTDPIRERGREDFEQRLRVARVTTFQERVQALLDSTLRDWLDADDLRACFEERAEPPAAGKPDSAVGVEPS